MRDCVRGFTGNLIELQMEVNSFFLTNNGDPDVDREMRKAIDFLRRWVNLMFIVVWNNACFRTLVCLIFC